MYKKIIKRFFDIILSLILMPIVLVILIILKIIFIFGDRGPLIYKSLRLGKDMKPFKMYKIRTMKVNAPDIRNDDGSTFNSENDERVTKIGRILRKTSIDELPQIFNVLLGQMSIVGPRPDLEEQKTFYENLNKNKFNVKPGITGFAQVNGRNSISWEEKNELDNYYSNNLSFWLDIKIFFKTFINVVKKKDINKG